MIKAIFYSKFDIKEGPKVVHQVPEGAIVPSTPALSQPLFLTFSDVSFFVIPRQELCGNLIQVCTNSYRILGYPICLKSPRYDRNEFIFNFCLVLAEEDDFSTYKSVVQRLADLMRELEEQSGFLSRDHSKSGEGKIYSLCETLMEDLNNYCESMIPIDDLNTLNIKLFPIFPAPPPVKAWQVPLFTVRYQAFMDENWDLTMQRIVPHINGVNSLRIISILADTDFSLTCRAIRHLLYYGCIFLLDIFSFSAIYAPTAQFSAAIASDQAMQQECARYVNTLFVPPLANPAAPTPAPTPSTQGHQLGSPRSELNPDSIGGGYFLDAEDVWPPIGSPTTDHHNNKSSPTDDIDPSTTIPTTTTAAATTTTTTSTREVVDGAAIVSLYASLKQGQNVKQWYLQHSRQLTHIDIRRFITFGIIKGFLYRVHKYAYATGLPAPPHKTVSSLPGSHGGISSRGPGTGANSPSFSSSVGDDVSPITIITNNNTSQNQYQNQGEDGGAGAGSGGGGHATSVQSGNNRSVLVVNGEEMDDFIDDKSLSKYLDGMHCFDQICTELEVSERELTARLKRYPGEVLIIHR